MIEVRLTRTGGLFLREVLDFRLDLRFCEREKLVHYLHGIGGVLSSAPSTGVLAVACFHERFGAIEKPLPAADALADGLEQLPVVSLLGCRSVVLDAKASETHHVDRIVGAVYAISRLVLSVARRGRLVGRFLY